VEQKDDPELAAMATLLSVLEPLSEAARLNVIEYVFKRLGIQFPSTSAPLNAPSPARTHEPLPPDDQSPTKVLLVTDIRALKDQKRPSTASEMVALVAYYLEHLAAPEERRSYITAADIRPYFVQADFPLPQAEPNMTLVNAKNAGYLDSTSRGQYKLNPVGHNLIAHRLPTSSSEQRGQARTRRRGSPKGVAKKKSRKA
jgi:hypothetical protein